MHNLCCDNCHSHVARALNLMQYDGSTRLTFSHQTFSTSSSFQLEHGDPVCSDAGAWEACELVWDVEDLASLPHPPRHRRHHRHPQPPQHPEAHVGKCLLVNCCVLFMFHPSNH